MVVVSGGGGKWPLIALSPLIGDVKTRGWFNMYLSSTYINIYQYRKMDIYQHRNIHISQHNIKNHFRRTQAPICNTQQKEIDQHIIPVSTNHVLIDPAGPIDFTPTPCRLWFCFKDCTELVKGTQRPEILQHKQHPSVTAGAVTAGDIFGVAVCLSFFDAFSKQGYLIAYVWEVPLDLETSQKGQR